MQSKEIVQKQFTKVFRGYDIQEVDLFLDEVIRSMEQYETEKQALLGRIERLLRELERMKEKDVKQYVGDKPLPAAGQK